MQLRNTGVFIIIDNKTHVIVVDQKLVKLRWTFEVETSLDVTKMEQSSVSDFDGKCTKNNSTKNIILICNLGYHKVGFATYNPVLLANLQ